MIEPILVVVVLLALGWQQLLAERLWLFGLAFAAALAATWADIPVSALAIRLLPASERMRAGGVRAAALSLGAIVGGGMMLLMQAKWGWRAPFVLVALPSLAAAAAILAVVRDPGRGAAEGLGAAAPPRSDARAVAQFFSVPTNVLAFAQGLAGCVPWGDAPPGPHQGGVCGSRRRCRASQAKCPRAACAQVALRGLDCR